MQEVRKSQNQDLRADPAWNIYFGKMKSNPRDFPGFRCQRAASRSFGLKCPEIMWPSGVGLFHRSGNCLLTSLVNSWPSGRRTDAFPWPSLLRHLLKCLPNLSSWERPLLPMLNVFGVGWVIIRPSQDAPAEILAKMTHDPTYSCWTPRGSLQKDLRLWASLYEQGFYHRPTRDPLHNCRQANDSQLLTIWVSPEQKSQPWHICPRAVGMVTGRSVSRTIRTEWWCVNVAGHKIINV